MSTDLHDRLARANPVPGPPETPPDAGLLSTILATPLEPARGLRGRFFLAGAAAAGVVVVVVAALLPGERLGPSPAAAQALERLAAASAAQPAPPAHSWAYTRARTLYGGTNLDDPPYTVLYPALRESWVAADGSGRIRETPGRPIYLNERDRAREVAGGGRTEAGATTDRRYRLLPASSWRMAATLPTDSQALEAALRRHIETNTIPAPEAGEMFAGEMRGLISSLLHSPAASAELRAALYRVLARQEGVELVGHVRDPEGRLGVGLEFRAGSGGGPMKKLLVVDSKTGEILAEQTIVQERVEWVDAEPGDVVGKIVYLEHGWVDSREERP